MIYLKIKLRLLLPFKKIVGKEELTIELEGSTLKSMLDCLTEQHPDLRSAIYDKEGKIDSFVNIFVNDKPTFAAQESQIKLKDGDEVLIFPAIAGG